MWKKTALLICDLQKRVLPHIKNNDRIIKNTQTLLDANAEYKRIQSGDNRVTAPIIVAELIPDKLGKTPISIMDRIKQSEKSFLYIEKGFYSVYNKELASSLRRERVNEIVLAGVQTEWCITKTALDFKKAGFSVLIPDDAVGSTDISEHIKALKRLSLNDIKIVTTHSFIVDNLSHVDDPMSKWYINYLRRQKQGDKEKEEERENDDNNKNASANNDNIINNSINNDNDDKKEEFRDLRKLYRELDDIYGDIRSIPRKS